MEKTWISDLEFTFVGTVFLRHNKKKNWFRQICIYMAADNTVAITNFAGRGKGSQNQAILGLGLKVKGHTLLKIDSLKTMDYTGKENVPPQTSFKVLKEEISAQYENAVWHWISEFK
jgi:ABC-type transport system involved in cytochrome c biogenesis ATPase subunit